MNKHKNKKIALIVLSVILSLLVVVWYVLKNDTKTSQTNGTELNQIDYQPPSEEERNAGNSKKEDLGNEVNDDEQNTGDDSDLQKANVVIVDASQYDEVIEVRAFVENIVQDGECTYTLKNTNETIMRTLPANAESSTSPCASLSLNRSEITNTGTWDVTVSYRSIDAYGSSSTAMEVR